MFDAMSDGLLYLIDSLFNLYLFILGVRLILVWVRADYFDPITKFTVMLTDPVVNPLRKFLPTPYRIEIPTLVVMFVLELVKFLLLMLLSSGMPNVLGLPILAIGDMLYLIIQAFMYAIVLQAILSILQPASPLMLSLRRVTDPILRPIQRILPLIGGLDLSPIPALILLQLCKIIFIGPIMAIGQSIALGY